MSAAWGRERLGNLLAPIERAESVDPSRTYRLLGARWYAQGLFVKDEKSGQNIKASTLYRVNVGDFVYNRLFAWKGSFAIADGDADNCYVSNEFPCFDVDGERLYPPYLKWWFSRESVWLQALGLSNGATPTSRNRLKEERLLGMEIPLPPMEEQRGIVARIEKLATKVEEARGLRISLRHEVQALQASASARIFAELLNGATRLLADSVLLERGKFSHRPRNDPRFFGGDHPWIQIAEIESSDKYIKKRHETLNDDGLAISRKFPRGTLLISIAATIGAVGILTFDCCVPDSIVAITPPEGINSEFVYHYLSFLRTHLEAVAPQSAQKNINLQIIGNLPFPIVEPNAQCEIVSELNALQAKVDPVKALQAETATELKALLPAILDKAFKGEL